jgi:hypothetical protein
MRKITAGLVRASRVWWVVLLAFVLNGASFAVLFSLEDQFEAITGQPVYDTQNNLTTREIVEQLPLYVGAAREAYLRFAAFDFVFPLVSALFLAVVWALCLRSLTWPVGERLLRWNVPTLVLLTTLFDWLENVSILVVLNAGAPDAAMEAVIVFKGLKLTMISVSGAVTMALVGLAVANAVARWWAGQRRVLPV